MHARIAEIAIAWSLAICGCGSTEQATATSDNSPTICDRESKVGSNVTARDCSPTMTDEQRRRTVEDIRHGMRPSPGHSHREEALP
jgi:hypothetical protein